MGDEGTMDREEMERLAKLSVTCPQHGVQVMTRMYRTGGSCPKCKGADCEPMDRAAEAFRASYEAHKPTPWTGWMP